jgi:predicted LPLAT superfamily acyltransferase
MEITQRSETKLGQELSEQRIAWTGRTHGGYFGNWFFIQLIRWGGVWLAYFWLLFVAAYFTFAKGMAYRASAEYLERIYGPSSWTRRMLLVYRHFLAHGVTLVDRAAVLMGRSQIECVFEGEELFMPHLEKGQGMILVGAHVGCWELGGHFLGRFGVPVNVVVIQREVASIQRLLDSVAQERRFRILTADDNPLRSVPILAALRRGEVVALLGDRSFGGDDVEVDFLGGKARLPVGPYRLAAASGAPVFHVFVFRERIKAYRFVAFGPESLSREELRSNPDAVRSRVCQYAARLEAVVRRHPYQWANFFPYWSAPPGEMTTLARSIPKTS